MTDENESIPTYKVTFCTVDPVAYEAVQKFCQQMSGELQPNEPKYELRAHAHWVGLHGTFIPLNEFGKPIEPAFCSRCEEFLTGSDYSKKVNGWYCPNCGAKMDEEEPDV